MGAVLAFAFTSRFFLARPAICFRWCRPFGRPLLSLGSDQKLSPVSGRPLLATSPFRRVENGI